MNNKNYKIICEEIENNNIILEDIIAEGLINNLKNMGKNAISGITNAANSMVEKFIAGIATLFGKPKKDGSINKVDSSVLAQKLSNNTIIKKLFGDSINEIINGCKSISKDDLMSIMDEKKVNQSLESLPDKENSENKQVEESIFFNYNKLFLICEATDDEKIDLSQYSIRIKPGEANPIKITDKDGKEITDEKIKQQIIQTILNNKKEEKIEENSKDTENKEDKEENSKEKLKDDESSAIGDASADSLSAAEWVINRGAKVLDIIQFPYNKEKLKEFIAKKIDSFSIIKDGKLKSKTALFSVVMRWIGLIVLIFMITTYASIGGVIAVGAYLGARLGKKAVSKIAMYGGKKYAEGVVSKADKDAKDEYEKLSELSKEEYLKKYTWAGFDSNKKSLTLNYSPIIRDNNLIFLSNNDKNDIITKKNFKMFTMILDAYLLLYSNLSGKQGKYFNKNADTDQKFVNLYNKLKMIDEGL